MIILMEATLKYINKKGLDVAKIMSIDKSKINIERVNNQYFRITDKIDNLN